MAAALAPAASWTVETHALASILDVLRLQVWATGGGEGQRPDPVPRPGHVDQDDVTEAVDKDLDPVSPEDFDIWYRSQFQVRSAENMWEQPPTTEEESDRGR